MNKTQTDRLAVLQAKGDKTPNEKAEMQDLLTIRDSVKVIAGTTSNLSEPLNLRFQHLSSIGTRTPQEESSFLALSDLDKKYLAFQGAMYAYPPASQLRDAWNDLELARSVYDTSGSVMGTIISSPVSGTVVK